MTSQARGLPEDLSTHSLEWLDHRDSQHDFYKARTDSSNQLIQDIQNWDEDKTDQITKVAHLLEVGSHNIDECFKWADSVWKSAKTAFHSCLDVDKNIAQQFVKTNLVEDFIHTNKKVSKERDHEAPETNNNMMDNYIVESLEILQQHRENHHKKMIESLKNSEEKVVQPLTGKSLDFQGTYYPKYKAIHKEILTFQNRLKSELNKRKKALNKLVKLIKTNQNLYSQNRLPKKDTAKCCIRYFIRTKECYSELIKINDGLVSAWKVYSESIVALNAHLHSSSIMFFENMQKYCFDPTFEPFATNIFDKINFVEENIEQRPDCVFDKQIWAQIRVFADGNDSPSEGPGGVQTLSALMKKVCGSVDNFLPKFCPLLGRMHETRDEKADDKYYLVVVSHDGFVSIFHHSEFGPNCYRQPVGLAELSDRCGKVKTKSVDWKKMVTLKGKKPGKWFGGSQIPFIMRSEEEAKTIEENMKKAQEFTSMMDKGSK